VRRNSRAALDFEMWNHRWLALYVTSFSRSSDFVQSCIYYHQDSKRDLDSQLRYCEMIPKCWLYIWIRVRKQRCSAVREKFDSARCAIRL
jgi:hypothetical protein